MMGSLASLCLGAGTESWAVGGYGCAEIMLGGAWGMYLDRQGNFLTARKARKSVIGNSCGCEMFIRASEELQNQLIIDQPGENHPELLG